MNADQVITEAAQRVRDRCLCDASARSGYRHCHQHGWTTTTDKENQE